MGKKTSRSEGPSKKDARSFHGTSGPPLAGGRLHVGKRRQVDSWRGGLRPARQGAPTGLNDDQRGLAIRYIPMAESLARGFEDRSAIERDELRSTAYMALVEAARTFDPYRKVNFAVFARHRIRGALRDYARFLLSENFRGDKRFRPRFEEMHHDAEARGQVVGIEEEMPPGAHIESIEGVEQWLRRLPPMHALTCRLIYLGRKSQEEVSQLLNCSKAHVSRMHTEALSWLIDGFVPSHRRKPKLGPDSNRTIEAREGSGQP